MKKVDLNVDIGEGFPHDEALLDFATSANVCCGEHAGSYELTQATAEMCLRRAIRVGAHPGYSDRAFMGRRSLAEAGEDADEWVSRLDSSISHLRRHAPIAYIKPHGAFYNDSATPLPADWKTDEGPVSEGPSYRPEKARLKSLNRAAWEVLVIAHSAPALMGLPGTTHELIPELHHSLLNRMPIAFIREGFADRRYLGDGRLMPRSNPGAVLNDPREIARQVLDLAPRVDSICLHGDTPNCLEFAELVKKTLVDAGYEVGY